MFKAHFARPGSKKKEIHANFNGGKLTSDAGVLLLQAVDQKLQLVSKINLCIADPRNQAFIDHQQHEILAQRIFALALGYEDVNDHDTMRKDPAFLAAIKNITDQNFPLASSPTICRLENRITDNEIATLSKLFVELFIESFDTPPKEITLDFDATNDTVHGNQIGECFNKYYDEHCFLPLYVFCGTQLLCCPRNVIVKAERLPDGANHIGKEGLR